MAFFNRSDVNTMRTSRKALNQGNDIQPAEGCFPSIVAVQTVTRDHDKYALTMMLIMEHLWNLAREREED